MTSSVLPIAEQQQQEQPWRDRNENEKLTEANCIETQNKQHDNTQQSAQTSEQPSKRQSTRSSHRPCRWRRADRRGTAHQEQPHCIAAGSCLSGTPVLRVGAAHQTASTPTLIALVVGSRPRRPSVIHSESLQNAASARDEPATRQQLRRRLQEQQHRSRRDPMVQTSSRALARRLPLSVLMISLALASALASASATWAAACRSRHAHSGRLTRHRMQLAIRIVATVAVQLIAATASDALHRKCRVTRTAPVRWRPPHCAQRVCLCCFRCVVPG